MDPNQRRKNDHDRKGKGGKTKLLRRRKPGTRNLSIASAEANPLHGEFYLSRRNADEVSWKQLSAEAQAQFSKAIETEWHGVLDFKAVTIIDSTQANVIREIQRDRGDIFPTCSALGGHRHWLQGQGQMVCARVQGP